MKREIRNAFGRNLALAVAFATAFAASADTLTWIGEGGNALWSNAANWSSSGDHATPQSGDSVVIDIGETATTVNNDIDNLSLALFTALGKNDVDLTIDGEPIGLAGTTDVNTTIWTNHCSIVLNAGVSLAGMLLLFQ